MSPHGYQPIYQITRGGIVESTHFGAAAVVDSTGRLLASIGDPHTVTFMRSSAKPFQAIPFIQAGGPARFGLTLRETALLCASHDGTDDHAATALGIQRKAGVSEDDLQCGIHPPGCAATRQRLERAGEAPTANRHNCSGKHSGMLAYCRMFDLPTENYLDPAHPLQQEILHTLADMAGLDPAEVHVGIDGCSAPNFALPLYHAARAYARLADPRDLPEPRRRACQTIHLAMSTHPDMIAGPGAFDTCLMEATAGSLISKGGAEGYQGIGIPAGADGSPGVGIAFKISDGGARRGAWSGSVLEILRQMGYLPADQLARLAEFGPAMQIRNFRQIIVGAGQPVFTLASTATKP
jgi:L-asparaginase II